MNDTTDKLSRFNPSDRRHVCDSEVTESDEPSTTNQGNTMIYLQTSHDETLIAKLARARKTPVICKLEGKARMYLLLPPNATVLSDFGNADGHTNFWYTLAEPGCRGRLKVVTEWRYEEDILNELLPIKGEPSKTLLSALLVCPEPILKEVYDWCLKYYENRFPTNDELLAYLETR